MLPFHKEARPAALLVAHHQKVGIGKLQDKTHCPHSTALLLECNPSLPRYPVTYLTECNHTASKDSSMTPKESCLALAGSRQRVLGCPISVCLEDQWHSHPPLHKP